MSEDKTKEDNKKQADKDKPKIDLNDSQMYDFICNLLKEVEGSDGDLFEYTPKSVKKLLAIHTGGLDPQKSHTWIFYNSTIFTSGITSIRAIIRKKFLALLQRKRLCPSLNSVLALFFLLNKIEIKFVI